VKLSKPFIKRFKIFSSINALRFNLGVANAQVRPNYNQFKLEETNRPVAIEFR
jgi:hypothetical protein